MPLIVALLSFLTFILTSTSYSVFLPNFTHCTKYYECVCCLIYPACSAHAPCIAKQKLHKIPCSGAWIIPCAKTDTLTEMTKVISRFSQFWECAQKFLNKFTYELKWSKKFSEPLCTNSTFLYKVFLKDAFPENVCLLETLWSPTQRHRRVDRRMEVFLYINYYFFKKHPKNHKSYYH
jgi:hypothetical protein